MAATHTPSALHALPAHQIAPIVGAYADSLDKVFLWAVPVALAGFVLALALKEVPLRDSAKASASDLGEGFGMPAGTSSEECLELAIAAILRARGREHAPAILERSKTTLSDAGAWGVIQITRFARVRGGADIDQIARHYHLPAAVLEPTFEQLAADGMLVRSSGALSLTAAGQTEVDQLTETLRAWLADQLADWDQPPDDQRIGRALARIARRMLADDEADGLPQPSAAATAAG